MVDLFILCVDRDGQPSRRQALDRIEQLATTVLSDDRLFLAENAWQEIEVWLLAGHTLPARWSWRAIRAEPQAKETYFLPFAMERGLVNEPGQGRRTLAIEAARRYGRIRQRCPEDVHALEQRIRGWITAKP